MNESGFELNFFVAVVSESRVKRSSYNISYIFGLSRLHISMPNKFALINISLKLGIECFVMRYAHIEYTRFIASGIIIF